jgi:hypothetical protein
MNEQQAIAHDAAAFEHRARVQRHMLVVERMYRILGGRPDAKALAVAVADELGLWEGDELPRWAMDAAEWAVEEAEKIRKGDGRWSVTSPGKT